jgi:6-phosphogluconolactonase
MSVRRFTSPDAASAAEACAHHILSVLDEILSGQEFATFAISGGSTPRLMFPKLAATKFPWDRVQLFWVDERCVAPTDPASNYKMAEETLIRPAHIPHRHVHRIAGELPPKTAAARYTEEIRQAFGLETGELPRFDLIHRGMGPDAHTASLFPGDPLIEDRENIVGSTFVEKFKQSRITLLAAPLAAANNTVLLVAGEDKQEALRAVFREEYNPMKYPAQIGTRDGRGVMWFLDQAAAKLMD